MDVTSSAASSGLLFYRRSRGFYLAIAALIAGIAGVCLGIFGPVPQETDKGLAPSLAQMGAGAGLGCIWAARRAANSAFPLEGGATDPLG